MHRLDSTQMKSFDMLKHSMSRVKDYQKTGRNYYTVGTVGPDNPRALVNQPGKGTKPRKTQGKGPEQESCHRHPNGREIH